MNSTNFRKLSLALIALWLVAVYLPIVGHDLHTDDFSRIADNAKLSPSYFRSLIFDNKSDGFYRPLNHLSFGLTYYFFGLNPYPYGLFNFFLLAVSAYLIYRIVEEIMQDTIFASLVVVGWLANVKVVSSVLLWAVGRTTGMDILFQLCAIFLILKSSEWNVPMCLGLSTLSTAFALLSKESAVIAFVFVFATAVFVHKTGRITLRHIATLSLLLVGVYAMYFYLRDQSQVMRISSAPPSYRWNFNPLFLMRNTISYMERSMIFSGLLIPLFWLLLPKRRDPTPVQGRSSRYVFVWLIAFAVALAPMVAVPSRSNLYAFFPSVFVVGAIISLFRMTSKWPQMDRSLNRCLVLMLVLMLVAAPISWSRGIQFHKRHRHVLDWTNIIANTLQKDRQTTVAIIYEPEAFAESRLEPRDFTFLEMALRLKGLDANIVVNPKDVSVSYSCFRLEGGDNKDSVGTLVTIDFRETSRAKPINKR